MPGSEILVDMHEWVLTHFKQLSLAVDKYAVGHQ